MNRLKINEVRLSGKGEGRLIKFTSGSHMLQNLERGQLFFNNIFKMNDPFEGTFRYKLSSDKEKFSKFYLRYFSDRAKLEYYFANKEEFHRLINRTFEYRFENNGVCCFSDEDRLLNMRMWAHYANSHKGICLIFERSLRFSTPSEFCMPDKIVAHPTGPHKIEYVEDFPDEDPLENKLSQKNFLTTKHIDWEYEKEYRFISAISGAYNFEKRALRQIVLGLNCDSETERFVSDILRTESYSHVVLKKTFRNTSDFSLIAKKVKIT